jgi:signal transduction histidine kinase
MEAMPKKGVVKIRTYFCNQSVILEVADNGVGIPKHVLNQLGTPFFTTKESGTGLGLPVCYGIAFRHNAAIDIKTNEAGTTFQVKFSIKEVLERTVS